MKVDPEAFARDVESAFYRQRPAPDRRGAQVTRVRVTSQAGSDFGLEVTFHALPDGPDAVDTIEGVLDLTRHLAGPSPEDLAAHWMQELDEMVLAR